HLLLAARQGAGALRTALMKAGKDFEHARTVGRTARSGAAVAAEIEIFLHRKIGEDPPALRHVDKPARHDRRWFLALDRDAAEADRARPGAHAAGDGAIEGRFADPVGAEHRDDLAGAAGEIDVVQHLGIAVTGAEAADIEERFSEHAPSRFWSPRRGRDRPR